MNPFFLLHSDMAPSVFTLIYPCKAFTPLCCSCTLLIAIEGFVVWSNWWKITVIDKESSWIFERTKSYCSLQLHLLNLAIDLFALKYWPIAQYISNIYYHHIFSPEKNRFTCCQLLCAVFHWNRDRKLSELFPWCSMVCRKVLFSRALAFSSCEGRKSIW